MRVRIDGTGRVVIPKALREAFGLRPDSQLELTADQGGIRLDPVDPAPRAIDDRTHPPRLTKVEDASLTDADVRTVRDALQR
jgi:AbrB family looped-hinge helix DNA binding protein